MKKILIVDDEKNIRNSIEMALNSMKLKYDYAVDGKDALEKINNLNYELILMDVKMPYKNGLEVLKEIRKIGITTKVIMMTAYGSVNIAVDAMKLGAVDFISKPFNVRELKNIINTNINRDREVIRIDKSSLEYIELAKNAIKEKDLDKARMLLKEALIIDTSNPAIQNLLGVIEEKSNNKSLAQKYYRAALSLDATYKPADRNLERTVMYYDSATSNVDLG